MDNFKILFGSSKTSLGLDKSKAEQKDSNWKTSRMRYNSTSSNASDMSACSSFEDEYHNRNTANTNTNSNNNNTNSRRKDCDNYFYIMWRS